MWFSLRKCCERKLGRNCCRSDTRKRTSTIRERRWRRSRRGEWWGWHHLTSFTVNWSSFCCVFRMNGRLWWFCSIWMVSKWRCPEGWSSWQRRRCSWRRQNCGFWIMISCTGTKAKYSFLLTRIKLGRGNDGNNCTIWSFNEILCSFLLRVIERTRISSWTGSQEWYGMSRSWRRRINNGRFCS